MPQNAVTAELCSFKSALCIQNHTPGFIVWSWILFQLWQCYMIHIHNTVLMNVIINKH